MKRVTLDASLTLEADGRTMKVLGDVEFRGLSDGNAGHGSSLIAAIAMDLADRADIGFDDVLENMATAHRLQQIYLSETRGDLPQEGDMNEKD